MKVFTNTKNEFYMDGYLNQNFSIAKEVIKNDWDMVFCIDGMEGSGKSVLAMQLAYFCDQTLDISRICFTPNELRKKIIESEKYTSIVYDEAYTGLSSRATMSLINRTLISMLAEIRQKNLFVFVVMPCFFDLDKYVALWRSRALIHVYTGKNFERGYFSFYNIHKKKELYVNGKKFYTYFKPKANFIGRFTNFYPIDEKEYKEKKRKSLINRELRREEQDRKREADNELFIRLVSSEEKMTHEQKISILGIPRPTYFYKLKKYREENGMI